MSSQKEQHRGRLFDNRDKRKPSQPDMQGEGQIDGKPYTISAWIREDQLALSFAPPREGTNTYPPEQFRGALEAGVVGHSGAGDSAPAWTGDITGEEGSFIVRAYEQQGKSGRYLRLELERATAAPTRD